MPTDEVSSEQQNLAPPETPTGSSSDLIHGLHGGRPSRESSIVLDREGRLFHEGVLIEHPGLVRGLRSWITLHPDDQRPILSNGYDWCYFHVEDAPFIVSALVVEKDGVTLKLFDDTEEPLVPDTLSVGEDGVVYARVKSGRLEARFSRHAQTQLAEILECADPPTVMVSGQAIVIPPRCPGRAPSP